MRHPLEKIISPDARAAAMILTGVPALLLLLRFVYVSRNLTVPGVVPQGMISFELAGDPLIVNSILHSWNPDQISSARWSLTLDYLFLVLYSNALAIACLWVAHWTEWRPARILGAWLAWGQWLAGAINAAESYALLNLLAGASVIATPDATLAAAARGLAFAKFFLVEAALAYIVVMYFALLASSRRFGRPLARI
jgi:hypothetical protein